MPDFNCKAVASELEQRYRLPAGLLYGLAATESSCNPRATGPSIYAKIGGKRIQTNAKGIVQIVPEYNPGVNPYDPIASLTYAAQRLRGWIDRFGNVPAAIAAWKAGEGAVAKAGGQVPTSGQGSYDQYVNEQTTSYVQKVLNYVKGSIAPNRPSGVAGYSSFTPEFRRTLILAVGFTLLALSITQVKIPLPKVLK